jgi:hypothetical protein
MVVMKLILKRSWVSSWSQVKLMRAAEMMDTSIGSVLQMKALVVLENHIHYHSLK